MPSQKSSNLFIEYACRSDIGRVRSENQDSYGKFPEDDLDLYSDQGQLFIVADGVGGHSDGKQASIMAVEVIGNIFSSDGSENKAQMLKNSIEKANKEIFTRSSGLDNLSRMATTCSALLLKGNTGMIGHVGDSRIYKIENGNIELLTTDHTQLQEFINKGILSEKEAESNPSKSILVRAVGIDEKVKVDIIENIELRDNQYFVLCSDGLAGVTSDELLKIVPGNSPEDSCEKLLSLALERGGKDNITVFVIRIASINDTPSNNTIHQSSVNNKKSISGILIAFIILLLIILGFAFRSCI